VLSSDDVAAVPGGQSLGAVDGSGVAEGDLTGDIVCGQRDFAVGADMTHPQRPLDTHFEDLIGVAVADIVGRRQAQPASVVAGADDVTGRGRKLI